MNNNLIIGLGGTGGRVLKELRKRIDDEKLNSPNIGFVYVDSSLELMNATDSPFNPSEFVNISINTDTAKAMAEFPKRYGPLEKIIESRSEQLKSYKPGLGTLQNRSLGSILMKANIVLNNNRNFTNVILETVHHITEITGNSNISNIYIIAGLAGGTGSGALIDAITTISAKYQYFDFRLHVIGILPFYCMPNKEYDKGRYYANAYAALLELNALSTGNYAPDGVNKDYLRRFNLYLLGDQNEHGDIITSEEVFSSVANLLFDFCLQEQSHQFKRFMLEIVPFQSIPECEEKHPVCMTNVFGIGIKRIIYPSRKILQRLISDLSIQAINQILYNNYVVFEGDTLLGNLLHESMDMKQAYEHNQIIKVVKGYVNDKNTDKAEKNNRKAEYYCQMFQLSDDYLTLFKPIDAWKNHKAPYRVPFIQYAEDAEQKIHGHKEFLIENVKELLILLDQPFDYHSVINIIDNANTFLPFDTFYIIDEISDKKEMGFLERGNYLLNYTRWIYDKDVIDYYSEAKREKCFIAEKIVERIKRHYWSELASHATSLADVELVCCDIIGYLKQSLQSYAEERKALLEQEDYLGSLHERLRISYYNLNFIHKVLLPKKPLCKLIDTLTGLCLLTSTRIEGLKFKQALLPEIINCLDTWHQKLIRIKEVIQQSAHRLEKNAELLKFKNAEERTNFTNPVIEVYNEEAYQALIESIKYDKRRLDVFIHDLLASASSFKELYIQLFNFPNSYQFKLEQSLSHDYDINNCLSTDIYEAIDQYVGKDKAEEFSMKAFKENVTLLPLNSKELAYASYDINGRVISPYRISEISMPKYGYYDLEGIISSIVKNDIRDYCIAESPIKNEIIIKTIIACFPIRAISCLPILKQQYDQLMKEDSQQAIAMLHIDDSCTNLPSLELDSVTK